jgi:hypothetical protein
MTYLTILRDCPRVNWPSFSVLYWAVSLLPSSSRVSQVLGLLICTLRCVPVHGPEDNILHTEHNSGVAVSTFSAYQMEQHPHLKQQ